MASWRTTSGSYPVTLCMPGMDYSMTVEDAMHLLRTAPKLAGPWEYRMHDGERYGACRYNERDVQVADVWHQSTHYETGVECWVARTHAGTVSGVSLADAMAEADKVMVAAGWVLAGEVSGG